MPKVYESLQQKIKCNTTVCPETGCWLWKLRLDKDGYGQSSHTPEKGNYKTIPAHRQSYIAFKGPIQEGLMCLHTCDSKYPVDSKEYRKCCNPDHIVLGTAQENIDRAKELKRTKAPSTAFKPGYGASETNVKAILTREQAIAILKRHKAGLQYGELKRIAEEYGIKYNTVQKLVAGDTWKDIDRISL